MKNQENVSKISEQKIENMKSELCLKDQQICELKLEIIKLNENSKKAQNEHNNENCKNLAEIEKLNSEIRKNNEKILIKDVENSEIKRKNVELIECIEISNENIMRLEQELIKTKQNLAEALNTIHEIEADGLIDEKMNFK